MGTKDTDAAGIVTTRGLPLYSLLVANGISVVGNMLTNLAVPWFVLQTTGSAARAGGVAFAIAVGSVAAGLFAGPFIDRLGYKRTSILADLVSGGTIALVPLLYHSLGLAYWQLLMLVLFNELFLTAGSTARNSLRPELAVMAGMGLERTNAAFQTVRSGATLLGPPLAGVLIVALTPSDVLWVDALTFFISAALVALAVPAILPLEDATQPQSRYFVELWQGLQFIRLRQLLLWLIIAGASMNFFIPPLFGVVLPVFANQVFGNAVDLGLMVAGFGAGSLVGAVLYGAVGEQLSRRLIFAGALLLSALPFWILLARPRLIVLIGALFILGVAVSSMSTLLATLTQEWTPAGMRGRVFGMQNALGWATIPLGNVVVGFAIEVTSLQMTLLALAACYLLVIMLLLVTPRLRDLGPPITAGE
jgi:MFS family permease